MRGALNSAFIFLLCIAFSAVPALGQSEEEPSRKLRVFDPAAEVQRLDPAMEMIIQKVDGDLTHILSSPVRMTPKGTALTGLTLLGTLYLLNVDEDLLSDASYDGEGETDEAFERLRVLGRNVPASAAGFYLLGYFLDSPGLKSKSLESLEAVAITALITAGSGYAIGHKGPDESERANQFEPFSGSRSMPDMTSALIFSMAGVYAYERPFTEAMVYYGIAAGAAYSRLYYGDSWPSDVFLGSVLGAAIGRSVAYRARSSAGTLSLLPVLEHRGHAAVGLRAEFTF